MAGDDLPLAPPEAPPALRRRVLGLAWPGIGENMLETSLDIINTILVAALGAAALAGVGSGLQIMFFVLAALAALSVGSSILVAQAVGAQDLDAPATWRGSRCFGASSSRSRSP